MPQKSIPIDLPKPIVGVSDTVEEAEFVDDDVESQDSSSSD